MKRKAFLALLPICITCLTGCTRNYTLTFVNSNKKAGTILTSSGKYKAGSKVKISVECVQGYDVDKWLNQNDCKVGDKKSFTFVMPSENTQLKVTYKYAKFELKVDDKFVADDDHYDYRDLEYTHFVYFEVDGTGSYHYASDFAWHDQVNIKMSYTQNLSDYEYLGLYDDTNKQIGFDQTTIEMPNRDYQVYGVFQSKAHGLIVSCNNTFFSTFYNVNCSYDRYTIGGDDPEHLLVFGDSGAENLEISYYQNSPNYLFNYWYDLDKEQIISTDETLVLHNYTSLRHLKAFISVQY